MTQFISGNLIKRYKRFLADVKLSNNDIVTAHCPNTGPMTSCLGDNWPVLMSPSNNPKRKLKYTLEYINGGESWIGVNTHRANSIVAEFLAKGELPGFPQEEFKREVKYGNSRFDFYLPRQDMYLEVKSATLKEGPFAAFPDTVSVRALKHVEELVKAMEAGHLATLLFLVQRSDVKKFQVADHIDPNYGRAISKALEKGLRISVIQSHFDNGQIKLSTLPFHHCPA